MTTKETRKIDAGIIQRNGSYRFTAYLGYDIHGKQIRKTATWVPPQGLTQRKADKIAKEKYIEFKNKCKGLTSYNENMRFSDLVDEYFKVYAPNKLKPATAYTYRKNVDFHFIEYFGNMKLKDISNHTLTNFFCNMKKKNKDGKEELVKPSTAKRVYNIMQSLFHFAVSQEYLKESPCHDVILPKNDVTQDDKRRYLTEEELPYFLKIFSKYDDLSVVVMFLLYTGLRCGEALGLQWKEIDFENNLIYVNHSLTDIGGKHFLTTPKTKTSKRVVFMSADLKRWLLLHKEEQNKLIKSVPSFKHKEMVFTSLNGEYRDRSSLNTSLKRRLRGTPFEFMSLHCLRHTNATLLLNSGVDLKIVSEHLGHSDVGTTGNIYAGVLNSTRRNTASLLESKILNATETQETTNSNQTPTQVSTINESIKDSSQLLN